MRHYVVIGLMLGDESKGATVQYLSSRYSNIDSRDRPKIVVRFNGGGQAGHNVIHGGKYGVKHTFSQFGAGYFNGTQTHLSRYSLVDPLAMINEAEHLKFQSSGDPLHTITVNRDALLVTPFHAAANKAREIERGASRHGSCGMGIGETMAFHINHDDDAPRVGDIQEPKTLRRKLWALHDYYSDIIPTSSMPPIDALITVYKDWANAVRLVDDFWLPTMLQHQSVIFEGAQGVLLDQDHGFHPYTTWSKTTFENAMTLLQEAGQEDNVTRVGCMRTYSTRHGAGPFPTESAEMTGSLLDLNNTTGAWQGDFRVGPLDLVLARYALDVVGGVDYLAVSHTDRVGPHASLCDEYRYSGNSLMHLPFSTVPDRQLQIRLTDILGRVEPVISTTDNILETIERGTGAHIGLISHGQHPTDKSILPVRSPVMV